MFSKFIESTSVVFVAFTVIAFSVAMVGANSDSNAKYVEPTAAPQVETPMKPAADYSDVPYEYASQPVQYINFPPMHIIVTPDLNN